MKYKYAAHFHCPSCVMKIEQELSNIDYIDNAEIDFKTGVISVETTDSQNREEQIKQLIINANPTIIFQEKKFSLMFWFSLAICIAAIIAFILAYIPFFQKVSAYLFIFSYASLSHELVINTVKCFAKKIFYDDSTIILIISIITMAFGEFLDGILIVTIWHASNLLIKLAMKNSNNHHACSGCSQSSNFLKYSKYIVPALVITGIALILILRFAIGTSSFSTLILSIIALSCPCPFIIGFTMLHIRTQRALNSLSNGQAAVGSNDFTQKQIAAYRKELEHYHIENISDKTLKIMHRSKHINLQNIIGIFVLKIVFIVLSTLFDSVLIAVSTDFVLIILATLNTLRIR